MSAPMGVEPLRYVVEAAPCNEPRHHDSCRPGSGPGRCDGCLGNGQRLQPASAMQVCECGHFVHDHTNSMKCRTCGSECGTDATLAITGERGPRHIGLVEAMDMMRDELDRIDEALERIDDHVSYLQGRWDGDEADDVADMIARLEADSQSIARAVSEARRLAAIGQVPA